MKKPTRAAGLRDLGTITIYKLFPTRASKKRIDLLPTQEEPPLAFKENASLIEYDIDKVKKTEVEKIEEFVDHASAWQIKSSHEDTEDVSN